MHWSDVYESGEWGERSFPIIKKLLLETEDFVTREAEQKLEHIRLNLILQKSVFPLRAERRFKEVLLRL